MGTTASRSSSASIAGQTREGSDAAPSTCPTPAPDHGSHVDLNTLATPSRMKPLTAKQQRFVDEYLIDMNAAAAARRAGYSEKTARVIGHENLTKPNIAATIAEARAQLSKKTNATVEWIVGELMRIASANILDYADFAPDGWVKLDMAKILRDLGGAITDFVIEEVVIVPVGQGKPRRVKRRFTIKMRSKCAALQALGKHLGMF